MDSTFLIQQATFNYRIKGYLSASDLFQEIYRRSDPIYNSHLVKEQLFDRLKEDKKMPADLKSELIDQILALEDRFVDKEFYEFEANFKNKEAEEVEKEAEEEKAEGEEQPDMQPTA